MSINSDELRGYARCRCDYFPAATAAVQNAEEKVKFEYRHKSTEQRPDLD